MPTFRALLLILLALFVQQSETIDPIHVESLAYPDLARNAQIQGTVEVRITVSADGSVAAASAISGHPLLARAARENALRWKFAPGIARETKILYYFTLEEPKTTYKPETRTLFDLPTRVQVVSTLPAPSH